MYLVYFAASCFIIASQAVSHPVYCEYKVSRGSEIKVHCSAVHFKNRPEIARSNLGCGTIYGGIGSCLHSTNKRSQPFENIWHQKRMITGMSLALQRDSLAGESTNGDAKPNKNILCVLFSWLGKPCSH